MDVLVILIQSGEGKVIIALMLFPFFGNFSSSPEPNSVDFVVSFNTIDSMDSEAIFSEVVNISEMSIFQVVGKISDNTFSFVFDVVDFPKWPTGMIELSPKFLEGGCFVRGIAELSLPIVNVEWRFREQVKRILLLFKLDSWVSLFLFIIWSFLFLLVLLLLLLLLLLYFLLFLLLLFLFLLFFLLLLLLLLLLLFLFFFLLFLFLLLVVNKFRQKFFSAEPWPSEKSWNFLVGEKSFIPMNQVRNGCSSFFIEDKSQEQSNTSNQGNISNANMVSSQVVGLRKLGISNLQSFKVVFLSSLILFLSNWEVSKDSVEGSVVEWVELSVDIFKPLINLCSLSSIVSIELSSLTGKESEDGSWFIDASLFSFKSWDFTKRVLGKIFRRFPLIPRNSNELDWELDKSKEKLDFSASSGVALRGVKLVWHLLKDIINKRNRIPTNSHNIPDIVPFEN